MGARIESACARRARRGPLAPGALEISDAVARDCLDRAQRLPGDLDLLVNAGLYKNKNMAEPALASIIQEDIGANPGHPPRRDRHGTFSFDVMNGGCGVLTALHLVDSFVGPGAAGLAMIVAADADPAHKTSRGFHFPPVGGALLLGHADDGEGFKRFEFHNFIEHIDLFESRVSFEPENGAHGESVLEVREDLRFAPLCISLATEVTVAFLGRAGLRAADVDLLIASAYPARFAREVAQNLGIGPDRVPELPPDLVSAHTAGPIATLATAMDTGMLARARNVLFVTAGAGITIAVAHYRR